MLALYRFTLFLSLLTLLGPDLTGKTSGKSSSGKSSSKGGSSKSGSSSSSSAWKTAGHYYYRMDDRSPATIQAARGFVAHNPSGTGSIIDHAENKLGLDDPWISTSPNLHLLQCGATYPGDCYIYYVDISGLYTIDVEEQFQNANLPNPHPAEQEISVHGYIPWDRIQGWDTYRRSRKIGSTSRASYERSQAGSSSRNKRRLLQSFTA